MRRSRYVALAAAVLMSCTEDNGSFTDATASGDDGAPDGPAFEVRYRTKYVDIAPGFSQPVCRGTLDEIDRHVEAIAGLLEIDVQTRPTWYWFNELAGGGHVDVDSCNWCSNCNACTRGGAVIYSDRRAALHELVHAVVTPSWGRSDVLFEEGVALGLDRISSGETHSVLGHERPSEVVDSHHGGGHFARWLIDRFGAQQFRRLFGPPLSESSTRDEVLAVVEEVYGVSFFELEAEYFATAPLLYPAPALCNGLVDVPWQGDVWELSTMADCDAPHVFGPRDEDAGLMVSVTVDVPDDLDGATMLFSGENHGAGRLTPCYDGPAYDESELRYRATAAAYVEAPDFQAGRYRLDLPVRDPSLLVHLRIEAQ